MPKKSPESSETFAFRIPSADREWLDQTAKANGIEVAQLVRWAVIAIKQYVDAHGGRIHLPLDIRTMWEQRQPAIQTLRAAEGQAPDPALPENAGFHDPKPVNYFPTPKKRGNGGK